MEDIVIEEICQCLAAVPLGKDSEHCHAPGAAFAGRLHDGNWQAEAVREDLLADDRRLEEAALRDHDVRLDALLLDEDVHADLERSEAAVELREHEVREVHVAVRRAHEERAARLDLRDVLARQAAVVEQAARIAVCALRHFKQRPVELGWRLAVTDELRELAEHANPGIEIARAVVGVYHGHRCAVRRRHDVDVAVHFLERCVEDVHRERRRADRDVARALADSVRRDHTRAGIALRRRHERARLQLARWVEQPCALLRELASRFTSAQRLRQDILELPGVGFDCVQPLELLEHRRIVEARLLVNREHARGIADAEYLLTAELPVHIAGQRRQKSDVLDMVFFIEDGLIEVRDAPALRDVEAEEIRELTCRLARDVVAPGPERCELLAILIKRQIAVHHRADADGANRLELHMVAALHIGRQTVERVLDAEPDRRKVVRPDTVLQLVLPAVARRSQRLASFIDQHHLDVRRAELNAKRCLTRADLCRWFFSFLTILCHEASLPRNS